MTGNELKKAMLLKMAKREGVLHGDTVAFWGRSGVARFVFTNRCLKYEFYEGKQWKTAQDYHYRDIKQVWWLKVLTDIKSQTKNGENNGQKNIEKSG